MTLVAGSPSEIDKLVRSFPWMDFRIEQFSQGMLIVHGYIDETEPPNLVVEFVEVAAVLAPCFWRTNTHADVFRLADEDRAKSINLDYDIDEGNSVFEFVAEDRVARATIVARSAVARLLREMPRFGEL